MFTEIQKPYYNSKDDPLGNFLPVDNGELIVSDIEALEAALRREAVKYLGREALQVVGRSVAFVGRALLSGVDTFVTSAQ